MSGCIGRTVAFYCLLRRILPAGALPPLVLRTGSEIDGIETWLDTHNLQADAVWQAGDHVTRGLQPAAVDTDLARAG